MAFYLNQTTGYSYTCLSELSSVRHAHEEKPAALQTCAQRTLPRLCPNVMWFDLEKDFFEDVELFNLVGKVMGGDLTLHWYDAKTERVRIAPKDPARFLQRTVAEYLERGERAGLAGRFERSRLPQYLKQLGI